MTDTHFKIMFEGKVRQGVDLDTAKTNLAGLFRSEPAAVQVLFNGQPVALKRGLPYPEAELYIKALNEAGVEASIEPDPAISLSLEETQRQKASAAPAQDSSPYAPPRSSVGPKMTEYSTLKLLSIRGRIGRVRYLAWTLVLSAAILTLLYISTLVMSLSLIGGGLAIAILLMGFVVVSTMVGIQRLHDLGWSGWLLLLTLVPFVGSFFPFLMMLLPGTRGPNAFGAPPPPNSTGVKITAGLWLVLIPLILIGGIRGGIGVLQDELELKTDQYEQSLPYDDENESDGSQLTPSDAEHTSEEENDQ